MTKLSETLSLLAEIKARAEMEPAKQTPGPWRWRRGFGHKGSACLMAEHSGTLLVLDAVRAGMQGAEVRFAIRTAGDLGGIMHKASELDLGIHPDAALMALAPDMAEALDEARALLEESLARIVADGNDMPLCADIREALGR